MYITDVSSVNKACSNEVTLKSYRTTENNKSKKDSYHFVMQGTQCTVVAYHNPTFVIPDDTYLI